MSALELGNSGSPETISVRSSRLAVVGEPSRAAADRAVTLLATALGAGATSPTAPVAGTGVDELHEHLGRLVVEAARRLRAPSRAAPPPRASHLSQLGPPVPVKPVRDPADLPVARLRTAGAALWLRNIGAIVVFAFVPYQLWGTGVLQRRSQHHLGAAFQAAKGDGGAAGAAPPAPSLAAPMAARPPVAPLPGGVVARLRIPAIHLDQFVVEGTTDSDLRRGPGHYVGSPMPGQPGNAAVAGHRTTYGAPFNRLGSLKPGDSIIATTSAGSFLYDVSSELTVSPRQISILDDYGDSRLTLTTCTPEFLATSRLVVVAQLMGPAPPAPAVHAAAPPPAPTRPVAVNAAVLKGLNATDRKGVDIGALPWVLMWCAALAGLGLAYRPLRRRLPVLSVIVVLAPLWSGGLLLLCEQLNRFVPPYV